MATLYIVASPIGNLKDITLRSLDILRSVDFIACEDTRRTIKLLNTYDIQKRLISLHAHSGPGKIEEVCGQLASGNSAAYLSDAGTPGISDPGTALVKRVREGGHAVIPIPGPSALTAIQSVAGGGGKTVTFEGFLSPKRGRRFHRLEQLVERKESFVLFESPHKILRLLENLVEICPYRSILVGREMTKMYEEYLEGFPTDILQELSKRQKIKGEFTILVGGEKKH